jgi:hypothetical protein
MYLHLMQFSVTTKVIRFPKKVARPPRASGGGGGTQYCAMLAAARPEWGA